MKYNCSKVINNNDLVYCLILVALFVDSFMICYHFDSGILVILCDIMMYLLCSPLSH